MGWSTGSEWVAQRWRSQLPSLSRDPGDDLTGEANSHDRVAQLVTRARNELTRLTPGPVGIGITRMSVWAPLSSEGTREAPEAKVFALSRGVPSGLSRSTEPETVEEARHALDYAIVVSVPSAAEFPRGALFLEGVPLVIRIQTRIRPLA